MALSEKYEGMWRDSIDLFQKNQCQLDNAIHSMEDTRRGTTLLSYFLENSVLTNNVCQFIQQLVQLEPEQYYYPANELHLTVLSIISCVSGFQLSNIHSERHIEAIQMALSEINAFEIDYQGITVSPACVLLKGFPADESLNKLRECLRISFDRCNIEHSIDTRYRISTAHTTIMRCQARFQQPEQLVTFLNTYKNEHFGSLTVKNLHYVFNNWYQQRSITQALRHFQIG